MAQDGGGMGPDSFVVDAALCRKDGICVQVCPVRILKAGPGGVPVMDEAMRNRCIACGQCMAFCPAAACAGPGLDPDGRRPLRAALYPAPEHIEELLFSRRSIRNFTEESVPRETLARILDVARFAPTGGNHQSLRWIVTDGRERSRALLALVIGWLRHLPETDPEMAAVTRAAGVVRAWDRGIDILSRNAPHIIIPVGPDADTGYGALPLLDAVIGLSHVEVVAQAHGVGCCWSGYLTRAFAHPAAAALRECIGLEPAERAFSGLVAGFPRFRPVSRPPRKPLRVTWR
jgi:nitroreductase/ferredoxin